MDLPKAEYFGAAEQRPQLCSYVRRRLHATNLLVLTGYLAWWVMDEMMAESAKEATCFLKVLANEKRLLILCHLANGEKTVTEFEQLMNIRQPTLSQQLARLRAEEMVETRREAKTIYYSLASTEAVLAVQLIYKVFCEQDDSPDIILSRFLDGVPNARPWQLLEA